MTGDSRAVDLERLILEPSETLEIEYKAWLKLRARPHKAKLAKELIALANHGGGQLVLGFSDPGLLPQPRPEDYGYVTTDYVNGIVAHYSDPPFHCDVAGVRGHVVVSVPPGATVPIRAKRGSQDKEIVADSYYIRRPGPNSEVPQSGLEWDSLLRRCIANRDAELEVLVRRVVRVMHTASEDLPVDGSVQIDDLLK